MSGILLFGGSFDPIHHGHLIVCRAAAEQLGVSRVVLVPSAQPPHKRGQSLAPPQDRLEMCRLAVRGDPLIEVSDWELCQPGPNYTLYTVQHFRSIAPSERICWLLGMDSLRDLPSWHRVSELADACTLVTARRPGVPTPDDALLRALLGDARVEVLRKSILETPWLEISATHVRERVRAGRSIRYLCPDSVCDHILARRLYL